jgi:hypothetical protein
MDWRDTVKKQQLYYIKFLDHAIGLEAPECEICGWLQEETEHYYKLSWWITNLKGEDFKSNLEEFCILKDVVLEVSHIDLQ